MQIIIVKILERVLSLVIWAHVDQRLLRLLIYVLGFEKMDQIWLLLGVISVQRRLKTLF